MIQGQQVTLRPWQESDLLFFGVLRNDIRTQAALASRARPNSATRVEAWLHGKDTSSDSAFFVIEQISDNKPIGFIELRSIDTVSRNAMLGVALSPTAQGQGLAAEAMALLEHYAADTFNLRKIVLHVVASNERAVSFYLKIGYATVGTLREHHYHDGQWDAVHIMEKVLTHTSLEA